MRKSFSKILPSIGLALAVGSPLAHAQMLLLVGSRQIPWSTLAAPGLQEELSSQARLYEASPALLAAIDENTLQILSTPVGRQFCPGNENDPDSIFTNWLGISSVAQAKAVCAGAPNATEVVREVKQTHRFYFVIDPAGVPFRSWTTASHQTIFFVSKPEMSEHELRADLAHEYAIAMDAKERLTAFDLHSCEVASAAIEPVIRYAFSAVRAFAIERKVLGENDPHLSCAEDLAQEVENVYQHLRFLARQDLFLLDPEIEAECETSFKYGISREDVSDAFALVSQSGVCENLATPELQYSSLSYLSHGPRPTGGVTIIKVRDPKEAQLLKSYFIYNGKELLPNPRMSDITLFSRAFQKFLNLKQTQVNLGAAK